MVFELPRQIRWNSYFEVPIYSSQFPPHKAGNCSQRYYVVVAIENGTTYCFTVMRPAKAAKMFKKSAIFKHNKVSPSMPCVAEYVTNGRTRSIRPAKIPDPKI